MTFPQKGAIGRGLRVLLGKPAFDDAAFSRWAIEHELVERVTPTRIATLADEFAELMGCQTRGAHRLTTKERWIYRSTWVAATVPEDSSDEFNGAAFTRWMIEIDLTDNVTSQQLIDHMTWWSLVLGNCSAPTNAPVQSLSPYGWERVRGKARARGDKIARDTLYRLVAQFDREAA